jgi:4-aminobutyrate aminotransferase-like enzyme
MPDDLPRVITDVPGPRSRDLAKRLEQVECPEVTCLREPPVFWERASGANVWDVDGNRYVDLLAGFGVAPLGYGHPEVLTRAARQAEQLQSALSDVYPARVKVELLEALERALPGDLGCAILSCSGSDAVESALKTALRATGRPGVVAFEGAYHGLGFGALDVTRSARPGAPASSRSRARTTASDSARSTSRTASTSAGRSRRACRIGRTSFPGATPTRLGTRSGGPTAARSWSSRSRGAAGSGRHPRASCATCDASPTRRACS